jgi:hypothetical protein
MPGSMPRTHHAPDDAENPTAQGFGPFECWQALIDNDEDVLDDVVQFVSAGPKMVCHRPNEIEVGLVNTSKTQGGIRFK